MQVCAVLQGSFPAVGSHEAALRGRLQHDGLHRRNACGAATTPRVPLKPR